MKKPRKTNRDGRPLFDPARMATPTPQEAPAAKPSDDRPLRVSELAQRIDSALRRGVPAPVRVVGEVVGFRDRTHWWFSLSDGEASIACVMFASAARKVGFDLTDGAEVVATGSVEHYAPQGRTQLYVTKLEPVGAGAMDLKLQALLKELKERGYFDPERKKPLPWFPKRVAVITSRTGAALQDVLSTMKKRCPAVEVVVIDVLVQGPGAVPAVVGALQHVSKNHERLGVDAVILTRGGGSPDDLAAFNDRAIADALFRCAVPVVAAIGHETDLTIAEMVADERCATPTQAAVRLTPDGAEVAQQLDSVARRLRAGVRTVMHERRHAAAQLGERLARVRPERVYAERRIVLAEVESRLTGALRRRRDRIDLRPLELRLDQALRVALERRKDRLKAAARSLEAVGPGSVLARGYSVTFDPKGKAVKSPSQVRSGDRIVTRVQEGEFASVVGEDVFERPAPPRREPTRSARRRPDGTMGLFGADEVR